MNSDVSKLIMFTSYVSKLTFTIFCNCKPYIAGTQLLVDAESGKPYVVMSENDGHGHGDGGHGDDDEDDHMHFDPSAHSTLRKNSTEEF